MLEVLVADDDPDVRESVAAALVNAGHRVTEASDGAEAAELLSTHVFDLAICDVQMPKLDGLALFRRIRRDSPRTAVVIMTSFAKIADVVDSMRGGAVNYVTKPFDPDDFAHTIVAPIAERRSLRKSFEDARARLTARSTGVTLVADSPSMRHLVLRLGVLAFTDASVLITGERGTGKELVARTIHAQGPRRDGPFVIVDCANLPDVALALREAPGGTLVLDGAETLSSVSQAYLARALDEPSAVARRSAGWKPLGVRLITLAKEGLTGRLEAGELLESLHYRLNGVELHVPTLGERGEDLCPLVTQLLRELVPPGRTPPSITLGAWRALTSHDFPGNVRELRWALEHALAMADGGPLDDAHLPASVRRARTDGVRRAP